MMILIPVAILGAGLVYLLVTAPKPAVSLAPPPPPPGAPPVVMPGSARALAYLQRLDSAAAAYRAARVFGGPATTMAAQTLAGTLEVVRTMAAQDLVAGRIVQADIDQIEQRISALKAEIARG